MSKSLEVAIQHILAGDWDETHAQTIANAIQLGRISVASGSSAVAVSGDVANSLIISGNHNTINRTVVIQGEAATAIQDLVSQQLGLVKISKSSLQGLIQQVRSHTSARILSLFSKIQLLNKRQVEVDQLYVDVYVLEMQDFRATITGLLEEQNVREQFDRLGLGKRGERTEGLEVATSAKHSRLMVLGKPGSGKTTFLRYLAVGCAKGEFLNDYIPVLLELRDVDEATFSLFQYIHGEFELEQEAQTEQILKQGQALILLDGLDEVPSSLQQTVQNQLRKFAKRYDKNRFVLTCRTQTTEYIPEQFQAVEVADFKVEQVECFALNWFSTTVETLEQAAELKEHFMQKLQESPQTAELAVTPVLLSLTCWIFGDLKCLPQKRSDLYRDGLHLLLQQWDERRAISRDLGSNCYQQLTTKERKQLLSYLAVRKFEHSDNFVLFEESELCSYIAEHLEIPVEASQAVLHAIAQQHGLLIERAHGIWSFSHLTFQEYLVATWFCNQTSFQSLSKNITNYRWREVFLLASEMAINRRELVLEMKQATDHLVAQDQLIQEVLVWVNEKSDSLGFEISCSDQLRILDQKQKPAYKTSLDQQALLRGLCFDLIYNYECGNGIIGNAELVSQLNIYITLKKNDQFIDSIVVLDFSLYWLFTFLEISAPYFLFENIYPELTKALGNCAKHCGVLNFMGLISINFFDRLLTLWQSLLSSNEISEETLRTWWNNEGKSLAEQLKEIIQQERNICRNWSFTEEAKELIQKYYTANRLLVYCITNTPNLELEAKEIIMSTLLLPSTKIENINRSLD
jgi:DNA polymerase III delta prime subunit